MAPLVASGAYVAYTENPAPVQELDARLVVAWIGDEPPIVRWLQYVGHYVMLRAESAEAYPLTRLSTSPTECRLPLPRRLVDQHPALRVPGGAGRAHHATY